MELTNFHFLIDHPAIYESMLTKILQNYTKLRDFHNDPPDFGMGVHLCNLLATRFNASLVPISDFKANSSKNNIKIYPFSFIDKVATAFHNQSSKNLILPSVFEVEPISYNFVYCSTIKKVEHEKFSLLTSLLSPADTTTWICLFVAIALVTFLVQREDKHADGWYTLITTISVLISPGMSGEIRSKSFLFLAWMCGCLVFITYYSGDLTSLVICPVPEMRVATFEQLVKNNFTLIYQNPGMSRIVRARVAKSRENSVKQDLLKLFDNREVVKGDMNFYDKFISGRKEASILPWMIATYRANKGNNLIQQRKIKKRRCYIGQEARFVSKRYFLFAEIDKLGVLVGQYFGRIVEAGFLDLWWREDLGVATSRRVQSRAKVISPTRLEHVKVEAPEPLELAGNVMDVIYLWMIGLIGSSVVFIVHFCNSIELN